ncbi:MAG: amidohydrolase family protein [Chromatiales bacterium]|jgi:N-acyl-D-amino-acid deacylase|nr:amidohydrolase family protein [Chromatiales bacterium]
MYDLIIKNATVVDGLGNAPHVCDVAVRDSRVAAIGDIAEPATTTVDGTGLMLTPGIIDLHTHYDAQVTWDPTLSPSPALGVTTVVMGNCGFGIVPSPPQARDLIMRNLSVVEGMDLAALRAGINWEFESFREFMDRMRRIQPYPNVAVFAGHSVIRTAVMGEEASQRKEATSDELHRMRELVREAMDAGAIGLGASYSLNHSGYGGVPMPSTITDLDEFEALVEAMGPPGRGVVQLASGAKTVDELAPIAGRYQRAMFKSTGVAMYNEQAPDRARNVFEACKDAQANGQPLYVQIPAQPLAFDFTMSNAYPFFSHDGFADVKAYSPEELVPALQSSSFRETFRNSLAAPKPGQIFQGNWERVVVAVTRESHQRYRNRTIAEIARSEGRDEVDVILDLSLAEDLETTFIGEFLNVGDDGVAELLRHDAGVVALSDAGAHLIFMCEAGYGLHFIAHWIRERGDFDIAEGVRRLTSHPAGLYGIKDRGRIEVGAYADMILFDFESVGVLPNEQVSDLPGGGPRTVRGAKGLKAVFVNGTQVHDGENYVAHEQGPGMVLDSFDRSSALGQPT